MNWEEVVFLQKKFSTIPTGADLHISKHLVSISLHLPLREPDFNSLFSSFLIDFAPAPLQSEPLQRKTNCLLCFIGTQTNQNPLTNRNPLH